MPTAPGEHGANKVEFDVGAFASKLSPTEIQHVTSLLKPSRVHAPRDRLRTWLFLLVFVVLVLAVGLTSLLVYTWDQSPGIATEGALESSGLLAVAIIGALGGLVRWIHKLRRDFPNAELAEDEKDMYILWLAESVLAPVKAAVLAILFVLVVRAGFAVPATGQGASGWNGLYAAAALAGLFSPEAIEKLEVIFHSMFGREDDEAE